MTTSPTLLPAFRRLAPAAPLVLRLPIGIIMTAHGLAKLNDGPAVAWGGFFDTLGIPAPAVVAWIVTLIEVVGGACLILGLFTRVAAVSFAAVMAGAIVLVSAKLGLRSHAMGPGADLNLSLLAGSLALAFIGPGRPSLDAALGLEQGAARAPTAPALVLSTPVAPEESVPGIVEIRSYTLREGTRPEFHRLVEEASIPLLRKWGVDVVAYGPSLHDDVSYYLIRAYADLEDLRRSEESFYGSDEWRDGPRDAILALIESYTSVVLELDAAAIDALRTATVAASN